MQSAAPTSWDFSVAHGRMGSRLLKASLQQTKNDRKYAEDFPFYGL